MVVLPSSSVAGIELSFYEAEYYRILQTNLASEVLIGAKSKDKWLWTQGDVSESATVGCGSTQSFQSLAKRIGLRETASSCRETSERSLCVMSTRARPLRPFCSIRLADLRPKLFGWLENLAGFRRGRRRRCQQVFIRLRGRAFRESPRLGRSAAPAKVDRGTRESPGSPPEDGWQPESACAYGKESQPRCK